MVATLWCSMTALFRLDAGRAQKIVDESGAEDRAQS
jgi:hypothetical protein